MNLHKNDDKKSDCDPDYKGSAEVDGVEYWVSGWVMTPKTDGQPPEVTRDDLPA